MRQCIEKGLVSGRLAATDSTHVKANASRASEQLVEMRSEPGAYWERLDSYGPKFVENIVQATSRDILCYAMRTLRCCSIVMHIHDEVVIEADRRMSLQAVCEQMGRTPPWAKGLRLRADGYETDFYKKD